MYRPGVKEWQEMRTLAGGSPLGALGRDSLKLGARYSGLVSGWYR